MKDYLHSLLKIIDYERYKITGVLAGLLIPVLLIYGCEIKIQSPFSGQDVTKVEFDSELKTELLDIDLMRLEIEKMQAAYSAKIVDIEDKKAYAVEQFTTKEENKQKALDLAGGVIATIATGGSVDTASLIISALSLAGIGLGLGSAADTVRKNSKITELKTTKVDNPA